MSLLMDALKKAEQEKKEAARRLKESELNTDGEEHAGQEESPPPAAEDTGPHETAGRSSTMELSLAPLENNHHVHSEEPEELTGPNEELQIRDDDVEDFRGDENRPPGAEPPPEPDAGEEEQPAAEQSGSYTIDEMEREEAAAAPDETFSGVDLDETMEREMFEATIDGEMDKGETGGLYDETLPGVTAAQMAEDIGSEDQPTPVAAQTVFTAGNTTQERSAGFKWILIGAAVVMILAAGVWYYYAVTPINRELPSPMVARGIETVPPPESGAVPARTEVAPPPAAEVASGDGAVPESTAQAVTPADETAPADPAGTTGGAGDAAAGAGMPESSEQVSGVMEGAPEATAAAAEGQQARPETPSQTGTEENPAESPDQAADSRPAPSVLPDTIEPPPSLIKISRSKAPERRGAMIERAYRSYKDGDYNAAADAYQEVLEQYPDNRDALLGLAAIALKQGDAERALRMYARILQLNPRDSLARAALINLSKTTAPLRGESTIKLMLQDTPNVPYLHFALGNVYASQSRWADAQQAFFDAYRLDSTNPDYALNLAISLDHMGKSDTALDYYRTALELAASGEASFDSGALKTRIATLEGARQP